MQTQNILDPDSTLIGLNICLLIRRATIVPYAKIMDPDESQKCKPFDTQSTLISTKNKNEWY